MSRLAFVVAMSLGLAVALSGCVNMSPRKSLERVAKDWSMTIRASQVMPLYPLEEDIRPGDVFLVTQSIEKEIESWEERGFLPLVNRYARIEIRRQVYDEFFRYASAANPPPSFDRHPKTAFPTYTFKIDSRGALGLAIPLSSVPVAFSASGARAATGSVVLTGADSLGLPDMDMDRELQRWANTNTNRAALGEQARMNRNPLLLRVITRVFSVSGATVSLAFEQFGGFGIQAGAPPATPDLVGATETDFNTMIANLNKEIALQKEVAAANPVTIPQGSTGQPNPDPTVAALEAELAAVKRLQAMAEIAAKRRNIQRTSMVDQFGGFILPGASGRIVGRSARGVAMTETFAQPLVVGYWALEYLVYPDGELIPLGALQHLVENPEEYRRVLSLAQAFEQDPFRESTPSSKGMQLKSRR